MVLSAYVPALHSLIFHSAELFLSLMIPLTYLLPWLLENQRTENFGLMAYTVFFLHGCVCVSFVIYCSLGF